MRDIADYTQKYYKEPGEHYQALYRKKLILDVMKKYSHSSILEIGCGLDPLFTHFGDYQKMTVVEPSRDFYENAVELSKEKKNVLCLKGFFGECVKASKLHKGENDYIILSSLLHELEDPKEILYDIWKICMKDTVVHINVPNAKSIHRLLAVEMGVIDSIYQLSEQQIDMQRYHVFDIEKLSKMVSDCGFEIIEKGSYYPKFFSGSQMDKILQNNIVSEKIFDGLYGLGKYLNEYGSEIYVNVRIK